jgi:hypothetical protein
MLTRVLRQADLLDQVMQRLGVDPVAAARVDNGIAFYEARTKCISCCQERECRAWLQFTSERLDPAEFCPNAQFLASHHDDES